MNTEKISYASMEKNEAYTLRANLNLPLCEPLPNKTKNIKYKIWNYSHWRVFYLPYDGVLSKPYWIIAIIQNKFHWFLF